MKHTRWNIANLISLYRIIVIPVLLVMIISNNQRAFTILLIVSLISDIMDGLIARSFNLQTELGARLDSIGDMGTYLTSVIALFVFEMQFLKDNFMFIGVVVLLYLIEVVVSLTKFGKISSFHTVLCKVAAYCQGIFLVSLLLVGFEPWLFYPTVIISSIAYLEEIMIVFILDRNISNVRNIRHAIIKKNRNDQ